jgi:hypothetical protein
MSNPFDNVPSSTNLPETPDKKDIANLAELVLRIEDATRRFEASAKSSEELAGAVFEALLDDDGTMKDFGHACEIRMMLRDEATTRAIFHDRLERQLDSIPTAIEATLSDDDRKRLDDNFKSWTDVFRLHLPTFGIVGLIVGICIMGSILVSRSAYETRRDYENRIEQLDRWFEDNAESIAFGQFYRENFPKQYRDWQTGRWQHDIAYRDSLRHAHSLNRLKRLYSPAE